MSVHAWWMIVVCLVVQATGGEIVADFSKPAGALRALHGINKGPLVAGGMLEVIEAQRALGIPWVRLHDCHWPNPDVVDIHTIFPIPDADPACAESYDFASTDEYLAAIRQTGAGIVYRLGESIEHTTRKRFVHPPKDPEHWAAVCLGIIRHYNEGWANGFRYDIPYWEIWNEPENRPVMWTGTDAEFFRLYATAARAIKASYPALKVGGPAVGNTGVWKDGEFRPSEFVVAFLDFCRRESVPLDFFSWHCYAADPADPAKRARAVRQWLDACGFTKTESHLNEWNYLPGDTWSPISRKAAPAVRAEAYRQMMEAPGAAFIAAALIGLQDAPLEMANLFHGEVGGFGLFTEHGVPTRNYDALLAFHHLLTTPLRVEVRGSAELPAAAGVNATRDTVNVLLSHTGGSGRDVRVILRHLPWSGATGVEMRRVEEARRLSDVQRFTLGQDGELLVELPKPGVVLLTLRPR